MSMSGSCSHLSSVAIGELPERADGCEDCLREGGVWLHASSGGARDRDLPPIRETAQVKADPDAWANRSARSSRGSTARVWPATGVCSTRSTTPNPRGSFSTSDIALARPDPADHDWCNASRKEHHPSGPAAWSRSSVVEPRAVPYHPPGEVPGQGTTCGTVETGLRAPGRGHRETSARTHKQK